MPKICDSQIPNLSLFVVLLERKAIIYGKLVWFRWLFFGIAHSHSSNESKVMRENVKICIFMFLQFCKKIFAKYFGLKNCS